MNASDRCGVIEISGLVPCIKGGITRGLKAQPYFVVISPVSKDLFI
jgi:hypothetical protein